MIAVNNLSVFNWHKQRGLFTDMKRSTQYSGESDGSQSLGEDTRGAINRVTVEPIVDRSRRHDDNLWEVLPDSNSRFAEHVDSSDSCWYEE